MRLLYLIADFFINTFGITQPTERARDRAAWFIAGITVAMIAGLAAVMLLGLHLVAAHGAQK